MAAFDDLSWHDIMNSPDHDKVFIDGERERLIDAVACTVVKHAITVDQLIAMLEPAGQLKDIGIDPTNILLLRLAPI